jgi:hypothetical protein
MRKSVRDEKVVTADGLCGVHDVVGRNSLKRKGDLVLHVLVPAPGMRNAAPIFDFFVILHGIVDSDSPTKSPIMRLQQCGDAGVLHYTRHHAPPLLRQQPFTALRG